MASLPLSLLLVAASAATIVLAGCDLGKPSGDPAANTAKPPTGPPKAGGGSYPLSAIRAIPDGCASASVLMASAPKTVGSDYRWPWTAQAMLANQQFNAVGGGTAPSAPGQVAFSVFEEDASFALVATCSDGGTCNRLAAMYKAVVRSSSPQVVCGKIPSLKGRSRPIDLIQSGNPQASLPATSDTVGQCARIAACLIATDSNTPGDPGTDCQKSPTKFKMSCAARYPCAEVLACLGR